MEIEINAAKNIISIEDLGLVITIESSALNCPLNCDR